MAKSPRTNSKSQANTPRFFLRSWEQVTPSGSPSNLSLKLPRNLRPQPSEPEGLQAVALPGPRRAVPLGVRARVCARVRGRTPRCDGGCLYLLPEVDGDVGDAQGHQEPDQGPVVRERREFHHSPLRGPTPRTHICRQGRNCAGCAGARAGGGRGPVEPGAETAGWLRCKRLLLAAEAAPRIPSPAILAAARPAPLHPRCPPAAPRSTAGDQSADGPGRR